MWILTPRLLNIFGDLLGKCLNEGRRVGGRPESISVDPAAYLTLTTLRGHEVALHGARSDRPGAG
jgi:hypothetical protein